MIYLLKCIGLNNHVQYTIIFRQANRGIMEEVAQPLVIATISSKILYCRRVHIQSLHWNTVCVKLTPKLIKI
jgi:hypothetical protein